MKQINFEVLTETSDSNEAIRIFIKETMADPLNNLEGFYRIPEVTWTFSIQHPILRYINDVDKFSIELAYIVDPPKNRAVHTLTPDEQFKNRIYFVIKRYFKE